MKVIANRLRRLDGQHDGAELDAWGQLPIEPLPLRLIRIQASRFRKNVRW